ncbi:hypothetical protein [Bradyrhizobium sp.]|uniref:hypothetical protein n=1 Tax=Bradyrhizobium sp. TaxID=376 RepID=UPI0025BFEC9C|nr:hypothetical protein [Bradyrhizobium sp.]
MGVVLKEPHPLEILDASDFIADVARTTIKAKNTDPLEVTTWPNPHDAGIVRWSMASYVGTAILAHGSLQPPSGQVAPANEESARAAMLVRPTALAATMP